MSDPAFRGQVVEAREAILEQRVRSPHWLLVRDKDESEAQLLALNR